MGLLSVPALTNHVLHSVDLLAAVGGVDDNMLLVLRRPHVGGASHHHRRVFVSIFVVFFLWLGFSTPSSSHHQTIHVVSSALG